MTTDDATVGQEEGEAIMEILTRLQAEPRPTTLQPIGCLGAVLAGIGLLALPWLGSVLGVGPAPVRFAAGALWVVLVLGGLLGVLGGGFVYRSPVGKVKEALALLEARQMDLPERELREAAVRILWDASVSVGPTSASLYDPVEEAVRLGATLPYVRAVERFLVDRGDLSPVFTKERAVGSEAASSGDPSAPPGETVPGLVSGMTGFGFDLLRHLPSDANLVFSPLSAWLTLMALVPGARGRTRDELIHALVPGTPAGYGDLAAAAGALARDLTTRRGTTGALDPTTGEWREEPAEFFVLEVATALWAAEGYPFHRDYVETLAAELSAQVASLDFADAPAAAERMNAWALDRTGGHIPSIVTPGEIHPLTRMALANATWFKAAWAAPFREEATAPSPFRTPGGEVMADMMRKTWDCRHVRLEDPPLEAVCLPYDAMEAWAVVPDPGRLSDTELSLGPELLERIRAGFREKEVTLHLPRFEFGAGVALETVLPELGIRLALSDDADFGGISPHPEGLALSSVRHQARIKVDEKGTEAAAVTLALMQALALPEEEPERVTLVVDRPFFFLVRDPDTGGVLFLARVVDPTA